MLNQINPLCPWFLARFPTSLRCRGSDGDVPCSLFPKIKTLLKIRSLSSILR
ncbi:hypothetical protein CKA32_000889 [Geitlerinema sp. FC II]|nr:hypothetical protein CKA32_000889 [Geitlerinema sp. FC II]